ncbi:NHL repeat-containing protein [Murinocardiopsis flavida]|uniref:NHL repeat-containing protein n=1 Tax=Murinocardiopsis flavida TaxID=645275 RepID=A0A2P8CBB7_9ACTN|nr:hypothetical protein [Murinocardiopsis flavida]PSK82237.1 NHL repeat-containing protein [Murinocardiopsis flavida]
MAARERRGGRLAAGVAALAMCALAVSPAAAHDKESERDSGGDHGKGAGPAPAREITTTAGTGEVGATGDGGPAVQATFDLPTAIAVGPGGILYVIDGARIREIAADGTIETVAGSGGPGFSGDGGPALRARFDPDGGGIAVAPDDTVYVADTANHRVRAIDPDKGTVRTVAGSGPHENPWLDGAFKGDGGPADKARLSRPSDVAVGSDGTLYIADAGNYRVRTVDPDSGKIETIAGVPHPGDGGSGFFPEPDTDDDGVPATETFVEPEGIDVGADGTVFFTENDKDRVRAVDPDNGKIRTVAGSAGLKSAGAVDVGEDGMVYVSDPEAFKVVAMDADSKNAADGVEAIAGSGSREYSGDGGPPTDAGLTPGGIALAGDHTLHVVDSGRIRTVAPAAKKRGAARAPDADIITVAGGGTTTLDDSWSPFGTIGARDLSIENPTRLDVGPDGVVTFDDAGNDRVAAVDPAAGTVGTVAGGGDVQQSDVTDSGIDPGDAAFLNPVAVAVAPDGTRYITGEDARLFSLDADGDTLAPYAEGAGAYEPKTADVAVGPNGDVYFTDGPDDRIRVVRKKGGKAATVAESSPGSGPSAALFGPQNVEHIAVGADGTVYYSDPAGSRVRAVDPGDGSVRIVAGNGRPGFSGDGRSALSAALAMPKGLDVGEDGTLYIADSGNNRIRAVDPDNGTIRTVAGTGPNWGKHNLATAYTGDLGGDGGPAARAKLNGPSDVAVGEDGVLYVADTGNHRIRAIGDPEVLPSPWGSWAVPVVAGVLLAAAVAAAVYLVRLRRRKAAKSAESAPEEAPAADPGPTPQPAPPDDGARPVDAGPVDNDPGGSDSDDEGPHDGDPEGGGPPGNGPGDAGPPSTGSQ